MDDVHNDRPQWCQQAQENCDDMIMTWFDMTLEVLSKRTVGLITMATKRIWKQRELCPHRTSPPLARPAASSSLASTATQCCPRKASTWLVPSRQSGRHGGRDPHTTPPLPTASERSLIARASKPFDTCHSTWTDAHLMHWLTLEQRTMAQTFATTRSTLSSERQRMYSTAFLIASVQNFNY